MIMAEYFRIVGNEDYTVRGKEQVRLSLDAVSDPKMLSITKKFEDRFFNPDYEEIFALLGYALSNPDDVIQLSALERRHFFLHRIGNQSQFLATLSYCMPSGELKAILDEAVTRIAHLLTGGER